MPSPKRPLLNDIKADNDSSRISEGNNDSSLDKQYRPPRRVLPKSAYMCDGKRIIDLVLTYKSCQKRTRKGKLHNKFRATFQSKMMAMGLELEYENMNDSTDGQTVYVKIHAPFSVLARQADLEKMQAPVQETDLEPKPMGVGKRVFHRILKYDPFDLAPELQLENKQFFTEAFDHDKVEEFIVKENDLFFPSNQRIYLTWSIVSGIQIKVLLDQQKISGKEMNSENGVTNNYQDEESQIPANKVTKTANISYLLSQGVYTSLYPLHDSDLTELDNDDEDYVDYSKIPIKQWPLRKYLHESWAQVKRWNCYQPLDTIREYYGEKIGIYYAWLGFYTHMLIAPAAFGVQVLLLGIIWAPYSEFQDWFCDRNNTVIFCRNCRESYCPFQSAQSMCKVALISRVFDNYGTTIYSCFMAIWVICFLKMWKRYQREICARWDVSEHEFGEEQVRPDYNLKVSTTRINPITHEIEPYLPVRSIGQRIAGSLSTVIFFVSIVVSLLMGVMFYKSVDVGPRIWYNRLSKRDKTTGAVSLLFSPTLVSSMTASTMNGICIIIMNRIYGVVCWYLTHMEMPRTAAIFEYSYTYKMFIFQFVNFYGALFYLAFVRGIITSNPLTSNSGFFSVPSCPPTGCLLDVSIQLAFIMTGNQVLNNIMEWGWPFYNRLIKKCGRRQRNKGNVRFTRWERDANLQDPPSINNFDNYLEMLIQYGFVTMFVPAFPLAPLAALINNIVEIRLDAFNMIRQTKRLLPVRAKDIGPWYELLVIVSKIAVFTNAFLIAFTSGFVEHMVYYSYRAEIGEQQYPRFMDYAIQPFNTSLWCNQQYFGHEFDKLNPLNCIMMQYQEDIKSIPSHFVNLKAYAFAYILREKSHELHKYLLTEYPEHPNVDIIIPFQGKDYNSDALIAMAKNAPTDHTFYESKLHQILTYQDPRYSGTNVTDFISSGEVARFYEEGGFSVIGDLTQFDPHLNLSKVETCYIREYVDPKKEYNKSDMWYRVLMAMLAFVIVFELVILIIQALLGYLIPDEPDHVTVWLQREKFLQRVWFKERELDGKYARTQEPIDVEELSDDDYFDAQNHL